MSMKNPRDITIGGTQDVFYSRAGIVTLPLITRAAGVRMWDEAGNEYIDASCGPMVSCLGHGNERVIEAMASQARRLDYAFSLVARNRPNAELAERLARLAGPGFERVAFASGGSEIMDRALQFARQFAVATGNSSRRAIITLEPSYHGGTIATSAISGDQSRSPFFQGFAQVSHTVPAPMPYRRPEGVSADEHEAVCAAALERKFEQLGAENVLAFVIEPIGGISRGAIAPSGDYLRAVRDICTRHGVLLIFDEIITGVGRTGPFFAMSHWPDAKPDILVIAKALGAGYAPIGAMLAPAAMVDRLADLTGFEFAYSYNANPIACAAALTVLDEIEERDLLTNAQHRAVQLEAGLRMLVERFEIIGDVRGCGLYWAVELVRDRKTKEMLPQEFRPTDRIRNHALLHGLMVYSRITSQGRYGHWFMIAPPLITTAMECAEILQRLEQALSSFEDELLEVGLLLRHASEVA
ncbi:MAG: aspartate aminotransferase family protein [Hyphomicrobiales bacterium]